MLHQHVCHGGIHFVPSTHDVVVTLVICHLTEIIHLSDLLHLRISLCDEFGFFLWNQNIVQIETQTAFECHLVTEILDVIEELRCACHTTGLDNLGDNALHGTFLQGDILIAYLLRHILVDHHASGSRFHQCAVDTHLDNRVNIHLPFVQRHKALFRTVEKLSLALLVLAGLGDIVKTQNHILRRNGNRIAVSGIQYVVRPQHQQLRLQYRLYTQRQMDSHLVTVKVGVETGTGQRMQLNSLTLYHSRLESQNAVTVQRRGAVQQHRMTLHHVLKNIPDDGIFAVDDFLG